MFIHEYPIAIGVPESEQSTRFQNVGLVTTRPYAMAMPRLRMRDDWLPISWVDWPPIVGQRSILMINTEDDQY